MKAISYLRVSTTDQDTEKNKADILTFCARQGFPMPTFVEDTASGKLDWQKRKLCQVMAELQPGDILVVSELSRLGRSMLECMELISILTRREVKLYALKGNWQLDGSLSSKIVAMAFAMAAEIERDLISARTKEAMRAAKARGIHCGRPRKVK